ncbi:MAG: hypothetical protein QF569_27875, partial [Candidatus Poribacteria bacterium]|nr:hypothetical protein [Candidatus Poribacteria bacterium]
SSGNAQGVIDQFGAPPLDGLNLVLGFDASDLVIALANATAKDKSSAFNQLSPIERGSMTTDQLSAAIRLTEGHSGNVLPGSVTAQDVIDEFAQLPLSVLAVTDFTFDHKDLIIALANGTAGDVSTSHAQLPPNKVGSVTADQLGAAVNLANDGGYPYPFTYGTDGTDGVNASQVVAALGELGETVGVERLIIAISKAKDDDGSGSVGLTEINLKNSSDATVNTNTLQAAININDATRTSLLPAGVTPTEVVTQLDWLNQTVELQTLRIALANNNSLSTAAVGLSVDPSSFLQAAVTAAEGIGSFSGARVDITVAAALLSLVTPDKTQVTAVTLQQMLDAYTYTDPDSSSSVTIKAAVANRLSVTEAQLIDALNGGGNFDAATQNVDLSISAAFLQVTLTSLVNALNENTNGSGETNFNAAAISIGSNKRSLLDALVLGRIETTYTLGFVQGLNIMSLPNKPNTPYTAKTLAEKIGDVTLIIRLDKTLQRFEAYIPTIETGNGFTINGGEGYIINTTQAKGSAFTGKVWVDAAPATTPVVADSLAIAAPSANTDSNIWAFVLAGKLPAELHTGGSMNFRLTDSLTGQILTEYSSLQTGDPVAELADNSFRLVMVDQLRRSVIKPQDQFKLEVFDLQDRLIGNTDLVIDADDLQQAFTVKKIEYNQIPEISRLLPNYPNPFNPETWIPFEIDCQSEVVITIYDIVGKPVRAIDLGFRHAGLYTTRTRAAYWDSKSELGEQVASGVYFYSLSAESDKSTFSATRQMIILK